MPTYSPSNDLFAIPERGFFQYAPDSRSSNNFGPLVQSDLVAARTGVTTINGLTFPGRSLVFRYYYLDAFTEQDTIDSSYLTALDQDFATVRAAGVKILPRFAYTNTTGYDATPARVLKHIDQLAPTLNKYADVIHALQAGFIGRWGEWYYTDHFGDSGNVTAQNIADRNAVISRLLTKLDPRIFILLRYTGTRQTYLGSTTANPGGDGNRLGLHNDAFLAPYGDYGTYTTFSSQNETANRAYVEALAGVPNGGESAQYSSPGSDWATAQPMLQTKHWSFINPNYHPDTISAWGQTNLNTVTRQIGHRLRLVSYTLPSTITAGATTSAQVVIANDGWAPATRNRPVNLILDNGSGSTLTVPFSGDLRAITPGGQVTLTASFTAPTATGTYSSYLALPDPSSNLAGRADYALRLANDGIWDANNGRHNLGYATAVQNGSGTVTPPTTSGLRRITKIRINGSLKTVRLL